MKCTLANYTANLHTGLKKYVQALSLIVFGHQLLTAIGYSKSNYKISKYANDLDSSICRKTDWNRGRTTNRHQQASRFHLLNTRSRA